MKKHSSKNEHSQSGGEPDAPAELERTDFGSGPDQVPSEAFLEETEVDRLKHELAEAEKRILLAQADLENFRRRMRRDMQDQLKYASLSLIAEVLDAVDNLNRALEAHHHEAASEALVQGVQMVAQQISQTLQNHGCKKIEAEGQPFDPNLHQAVQMRPTAEAAPNTVIMDLRSGFTLHDRVVRPAQVIVSSTPQ